MKNLLCVIPRAHIHISLSKRCLEMELLGWEDWKGRKRKKRWYFFFTLCCGWNLQKMADLLCFEAPASSTRLVHSPCSRQVALPPGLWSHRLLPLSLQLQGWWWLQAVTNLWVTSPFPAALPALPPPSDLIPCIKVPLLICIWHGFCFPGWTLTDL